MKQVKGFTLIELLIAIAIVGILTAIAYPMYLDAVRKSNRAEAKVELLDISQRLQRCYTSFARFNDPVNCAVYVDLVGTGIWTRGSAFYLVSITALGAGAAETTYQLKAVAKKAPQTGDTANGCNELTLDHTGVQLPDVCW